MANQRRSPLGDRLASHQQTYAAERLRRRKDAERRLAEQRGVPEAVLRRDSEAPLTAALLGLRVLPATAGSMLGPWTGAAGGAIGETAAQTVERLTGRREGYNKATIGMEAALGAIPFQKLRVLKNLGQSGRAGRIVAEGVKGSAIGAGSTGAIQLTEEGKLDPKGMAMGAGFGAVLGAGGATAMTRDAPAGTTTRGYENLPAESVARLVTRTAGGDEHVYLRAVRAYTRKVQQLHNALNEGKPLDKILTFFDTQALQRLPNEIKAKLNRRLGRSFTFTESKLEPLRETLIRKLEEFDIPTADVVRRLHPLREHPLSETITSLTKALQKEPVGSAIGTGIRYPEDIKAGLVPPTSGRNPGFNRAYEYDFGKPLVEEQTVGWLGEGSKHSRTGMIPHREMSAVARLRDQIGRAMSDVNPKGVAYGLIDPDFPYWQQYIKSASDPGALPRTQLRTAGWEKRGRANPNPKLKARSKNLEWNTTGHDLFDIVYPLSGNDMQGMRVLTSPNQPKGRPTPDPITLSGSSAKSTGRTRGIGQEAWESGIGGARDIIYQATSPQVLDGLGGFTMSVGKVDVPKVGSVMYLSVLDEWGMNPQTSGGMPSWVRPLMKAGRKALGTPFMVYERIPVKVVTVDPTGTFSGDTTRQVLEYDFDTAKKLFAAGELDYNGVKTVGQMMHAVDKAGKVKDQVDLLKTLYQGGRAGKAERLVGLLQGSLTNPKVTPPTPRNQALVDKVLGPYSPLEGIARRERPGIVLPPAHLMP